VSKRKKQMAATKKANQKSRNAALHARQVKQREADRAEHAAKWNAKRKAAPA
jgi:hypothetical protein